MSSDSAYWGETVQQALEHHLGNSRFEETLGKFFPPNMQVRITEVCLISDLPSACVAQPALRRGVVLRLVDEHSGRTECLLMPIAVTESNASLDDITCTDGDLNQAGIR